MSYLYENDQENVNFIIENKTLISQIKIINTIYKCLIYMKMTKRM